jgi:hypothetical protein
MILHLDLAFPSCFNRLLLPRVLLSSVPTLQTHQIHMPMLVCTLWHVFGGLTTTDFSSNACFLTRNTSHGPHARMDVLNSMLILRQLALLRRGEPLPKPGIPMLR